MFVSLKWIVAFVNFGRFGRPERRGLGQVVADWAPVVPAASVPAGTRSSARASDAGAPAARSAAESRKVKPARMLVTPIRPLLGLPRTDPSVPNALRNGKRSCSVAGLSRVRTSVCRLHLDAVRECGRAALCPVHASPVAESRVGGGGRRRGPELALLVRHRHVDRRPLRVGGRQHEALDRNFLPALAGGPPLGGAQPA